MTPPLLKRSTWHILNTGPAHAPERGHLHVILTNPCPAQKLLLVPISSRHPKCDTSCLLGKGDHPFLKHDSFVFYARAGIYSATDIHQRILSSDITYRGLIEERVFGFICKGVLESPHLPPKFKKYYVDNA